MKKTFVVVTENRSGHNGHYGGGHFGEYAHVIAPHNQCFILSVKLLEEHNHFLSGQLDWHKNYVKLEITIDEKLMVAGDYILVHHKYSGNPDIFGDDDREIY